MKIYMLTPLGKRLARSTHNPDTTAWRIVHHLDSVGHSTPDQVSQFVGVSEGETAGILAGLRRKGVVSEASETMEGGNY